MISNEITRFLRPEPHFRDGVGACLWMSVKQKVRNRLPHIDPNIAAEDWMEQFKLGSKRVRLGLVGTKVTPALEHRLELFLKTVIEISH